MVAGGVVKKALAVSTLFKQYAPILSEILNFHLPRQLYSGHNIYFLEAIEQHRRAQYNSYEMVTVILCGVHLQSYNVRTLLLY